MITETEQARLKAIEAVFHTDTIQMNGEDIPDELRAEVVGNGMATLDALFAIREGTEWRGITDPQEIARAALRAGKIGE